ncbi:MAG: TetR/AcrR family transcriptional regulator [Polyangiales bacterium]
MARPPDADSAATYDRIVTVTQALIAEHGVSAVSLRRVAKESGQSLGAITYYFESRSGLLEASLDASYEWMRAEVRDAIGRIRAGEDLQEVVEQFVRHLFTKARTHQEVLRTRNLTTMSAGALPKSRLAGELAPQLEKVAKALGGDEGKSRRDAKLRLAAHTLELIVVRYALHTDDELRSITNLDDLGDALAVVQEHLVRLSLDGFRAALA